MTETVQGPNPDAPENWRAVNVAFISQSAPNIRKKLQKLEGFEEKSISKLVEVAQKVFNNQEDPIAGLNTWMTKALLAISEKKGPRGRRDNTGQEKPRRRKEVQPRLEQNQCAFCRKEGHWKRECPEHAGEPTPSHAGGGGGLGLSGLSWPPGAQNDPDSGGQKGRLSCTTHSTHSGPLVGKGKKSEHFSFLKTAALEPCHTPP